MSLSFDGANDFADSSGTPPVTGYPCTISCWAKAAGTGTLDVLVALGRSDGAANDYFVLRRTSASECEASVRDGTTTNSATSSNVAADTNWHHYCGVFASATSRYAYLDGTQSPQSVTSRTPAAFAKYRVGGLMDGTLDWEGYIAHVAVWDVALTSTQVGLLAAGNSPLTVDATNLVWYIPATASGTPFADSIGSYDLSAVGGTAYSSENPSVAARYLKFLVDSTAASAASVEGVVLNAARDTVIGEFSGQTFEAALESGDAVLKVPVTDISPDGSTLTTSDTPLAIAYNATYTTPLLSCTVIEE